MISLVELALGTNVLPQTFEYIRKTGVRESRNERRASLLDRREECECSSKRTACNRGRECETAMIPVQGNKPPHHFRACKGRSFPPPLSHDSQPIPHPHPGRAHAREAYLASTCDEGMCCSCTQWRFLCYRGAIPATSTSVPRARRPTQDHWLHRNFVPQENPNGASSGLIVETEHHASSTSRWRCSL